MIPCLVPPIAFTFAAVLFRIPVVWLPPAVLVGDEGVVGPQLLPWLSGSAPCPWLGTADLQLFA